MEFKYVKLGVARMVPSDQHDGPGVPIEGNYIYGVKQVNRDGSTVVLGLVQENPSLPGRHIAVAAYSDGVFPAVDFKRGLWEMTPSRNGFTSRRMAAVWLVGARDARQAWFTEAMDGASV